MNPIDGFWMTVTYLGVAIVFFVIYATLGWYLHKKSLICRSVKEDG